METALWSLLLGLLVLRTMGANEHYDICQKKTGDCCNLCNPGYLLNMMNGCGKCTPCPKGSFMETSNDNSSCKRCKTCENIFEYKRKCTPTSNAVCKCTKGKICVGANCEMCTIYGCPEGQELTGEKCTDCPDGTFKPGGEGKCKPWKICPNGVKAVFNGTRTSDVVCGETVSHTSERSSTASPEVTKRPIIKPEDKKTDNVNVIPKNVTNRDPGLGPSVNAILIHVLIVGGVIISLASLFCSLPYLKKWMKKIKQEFKKCSNQPVKTSEEEEEIGFPYPEKEQGEEEEPINKEPC